MIAEQKTVTPIQDATHELENTETITDAHLLRFPPEDPTTEQEMHLIETSGALDFWDRPEEDGYTSNDGEPI